ncbi:MAG: hypothetical protein R3E01_09950 [Pirellulaceae bacterium]|nr:hypothetical protein [Planctomycetales bacterium]
MMKRLLVLIATVAYAPAVSRAQTFDFTWDSTAGGVRAWHTGSNWAGGQVPTSGDILVQSYYGGTINGSVGTLNARSITVSSGLGITSLSVEGDIRLTDRFTIGARARVGIGNSLSLVAEERIANSGLLSLFSGGDIATNTFINDGTVRAFGFVEINAPTSNSGRIEILDSPSMTFTGNVTNHTDGLLAIRMGTLRATDGFDNAGVIAVGDGNSDVFADIVNTGAIGASSRANMSLVGDLVQNGRLNINPGGRVVVYGDFSGDGGTVGGGTLEVLGEMSVGNSPAATTFDGDLSFGRRTVIELGGQEPTEYDSIHVTGKANVGGQLEIRLLDGFAPSVGDTFQVVSAESGIDGRFIVGDLPLVSDVLKLYVAQTDSKVLVRTVPIVDGDYNGNGVVDAADYTVWKDSFGSRLELASDGNLNGAIDAADYTIWKDNFGSRVKAINAVPEPSSRAMWQMPIAFATALASLRRRTGFLNRPAIPVECQQW